MASKQLELLRKLICNQDRHKSKLTASILMHNQTVHLKKPASTSQRRKSNTVASRVIHSAQIYIKLSTTISAQK